MNLKFVVEPLLRGARDLGVCHKESSAWISDVLSEARGLATLVRCSLFHGVYSVEFLFTFGVSFQT